ncbi:MAG: DUF2199 domain-containing protein, partial [Planctomycetota bacterium]
PEAEFEARVELNADQCVVDGRIYFLRGHLELPIVDRDETFAWSVWCSLSERSFAHVCERWDDANRAGDRYFGWLCTPLPTYSENTLHLKTDVISRLPGEVPQIELHACEHPLYREQRDGIAMSRVEEIAQALHHRQTDAES